MCDHFNQNITIIKGVGQQRAQLFSKLGIRSVGALLRFYPRSYEDWSNPTTVIDSVGDDSPFILARVISPVTENRIRAGMTLYKCRAADENGTRINLTFFNNPYIKSSIKIDNDYIFHGKLTYSGTFAEMASPVFRPAGGDAQRLTPIYPQTEGLSSRIIEQSVKYALAGLPQPLPDPIPQKTREAHNLMPLDEALRHVHQPDSLSNAHEARRRFIFEELLIFSLGMMSIKGRDRTGTAPVIPHDFTDEFFSLLPFEPTGAQRRAASECMHDMMSGGAPMARLIQGDVGSGKTAVAASLCYSAAKCGYQSAMMAPTEILAEQHYATLSKMLDGTGINVVLLTGSVTGVRRREVLAALASGEASVIVGTHALISDPVEFHSLALVITDEQHRFGVAQRAALAAKGRDPHMLVMSATPIPRTLAFIIFGDLDVSILDEMPVGRIPIETFHIDTGKRERAYGFIRKHLDQGLQAYVVCPLVEMGESDLASAEEYASKLAAKEFAGYKVALLHGRMRPADKEYVMRRFAAGEIDLLVSTTVIEVGVDVPNAVIMLIENAERFGLSQLHQLRGRVGRGRHKSYCILVSDAKGETARARLGTMVRTCDGFEISSEDLRLRGPGDFFGLRQHGLPHLQIASLESDMRILAEAQQEAQLILGTDPGLNLAVNRLLRHEIDRLFSETAY